MSKNWLSRAEPRAAHETLVLLLEHLADNGQQLQTHTVTIARMQHEINKLSLAVRVLEHDITHTKDAYIFLYGSLKQRLLWLWRGKA